jgi:hypothetical protein
MTLTRWVGLIGLVLVAGGCSSFKQDYEAAVAARAFDATADSVTGPWEGQWISQNGHGGGKLMAILTRRSPETIHARFRSTYAWILHGEDEVDFDVWSAGDLKASGQADLGFMKGGVYQYDATITPTTIDATYRSKFDHGTWHLSRPVATAP